MANWWDNYQQLSVPFVPKNNDPRSHIALIEHILGAPLFFPTLEDLFALHPDKMVMGRPATVLEHIRSDSSKFPRTEYYLKVDPSTITHGEITEDNFLNYWQPKTTSKPAGTPIIEYAPDKDGGRPTYPYTVASEASDGWSSTYDPKIHRWIRIRTSDRQDSNGLWLDITKPIPIGAVFEEGDYVDIRFIRSATLPPTPPTYINGVLNNEPSGYSDTPPTGTDPLYMIKGQKNLYGRLQSDWLGPLLIPEDEDIIRYNSKASPHPDDIAASNGLNPLVTSAAEGSAFDGYLDDEGWEKTFDPAKRHAFMAIRTKNGTNDYTNFVVQKIAEESGEYTDYAYKLVNISQDLDLVSVPAGRDAAKEGYSDVPLPETPDQYNVVITARKYNDGTLKSPWSRPVPWNGISALQDLIYSADDNFKFAAGTSTPQPASIVLEARLYKGVNKLWEQSGVTINYIWQKIYDNGAPVSTVGRSAPYNDPYYDFLDEGAGQMYPAIGTGRTKSISHTDVTGKAVFRVWQIFVMSGTNDIIRQAEKSIIDITDGLDAPNLTITPSTHMIVYDTNQTDLYPAQVTLHAGHANLPGTAMFTFWKWTGSAWSKIVTQADNKYTFTVTSHFANNGTRETIIFAVTNFDDTGGLDPDDANYTDKFQDRATIYKISTASVGTSGENSAAAWLSNESHTIVTDKATNDPLTGEVAKAKTKVYVYDGFTKKNVADWDDVSGEPPGTKIVVTDDNNSTFTLTNNTDHYEVALNTWDNTKSSVKATIKVQYNGITFEREFTIAATKDAPGAIIVDIDCAQGYVWDKDNRTNKSLVAHLFDTDLTPGSDEVAAGSWTSIQWYRNGAALNGAEAGIISGHQSQTLVISRNAANYSAIFKAVIVYNGYTRSRQVTIYDVADARIRIYLTDATSINATPVPPDTQGFDASFSAYGVTWRRNDQSYWETNTPVFELRGEEDPDNPGKYIWYPPFRIQGEKGEKGDGGAILSLFKYATSQPQIPAKNSTDVNFPSIGTMLNAGWVRPENYPANRPVWEAIAEFKISPTSLDASGKLKTDQEPVAQWKVGQHSGDKGQDGQDGQDGVFIPNQHFWADANWNVLATSGNLSVQYRKDKIGFVHMRGRFPYQTSVIGSLPSGYRPENTFAFPISERYKRYTVPGANDIVNRTGEVFVSTAGAVWFNDRTSGSGIILSEGYANFDTIRFLAAT